MSDGSITLNYLVEERRNGWLFQFPPKTGIWRGPYDTEDAAHKAAAKVVEELMAQRVKSALGLN